MVGEYDEEMKKSNKTIVKNFHSKTAKAIKEHNLTYSGWLKFIKKLSDAETLSLYDDTKRDSKLREEYNLWFKENKK